MLPLLENTKFGVTLNNHTGLPPTVFTKAYKEDFRGLFRIILRDAFKGPELAKRKAKIVSMSINYVFVLELKGVYRLMITFKILSSMNLVYSEEKIPMNLTDY